MRPERHLAEINIARLKFPIEDSRVEPFVENLGRVNAVAERSPGFVWRLQDGDSDGATGIAWSDEENVIVNMSVWETAEALENFVWRTVHRQFYARRAEWFEMLESQHFAMWWVEPGHEPTLDEARERLALLERMGPTADAFGWESLPQVQDWRTMRCA